MEKIGIKAIILEFTEPIIEHDDDCGVIKISKYFKGTPCYVKISDFNNDSFNLNFENHRNLRISKTSFYESGVEETIENDSACGYWIKLKELIKSVTIIFENETSITYDLQNKISFDNFYRNMKTYIDSGYTDLPTKSSLEKAAELLDNDEFDDI